MNASCLRAIVAKDLRRFWPVLTGMAVLGVVPLMDASRGAQGWLVLGEALRFLLLGLFAITLVQADSPVSARGDWHSRPIAPGVLLAAKVIVIAVGLGLPSAVVVCVLQLAFGFALPSAIVVGFSFGSALMYAALIMAVFGALFESLLGAVMAVAAVAFGLGLLVWLVAVDDVALLPAVPFGTFARDAAPSEYALLEYAVALVLVVAVLGIQFSFRRRWLTGLIAVAGTATLWYALSVGSDRILARNDGALAAADGLRLVPLDARAEISAPRGRDAMASVNAKWMGAPPSVRLRLSQLQSRFTPKAGAPFVMARPWRAVSGGWAAADTADGALCAALRAAAPDESAARFDLNVLRIPHRERTALEGRTGRLDCFVLADGQTLRPVTEMTLQSGSAWSGVGWRWSIPSVRLLEEDGAVEVQVNTIRLTTSSLPQGYRGDSTIDYALVNRGVGEFAPLERIARSSTASVDTVAHQWAELRFDARRTWNSPALKRGFTMDWLRGAKLAIFETVPAGHRILNFTLADLKLPSS